MEYKFVYIKSKTSDMGGWWLEVTTLEQLFDYHEKTDRRWGRAVENWLNSKEATAGGYNEHMKPLTLSIALNAESKGHSIIDATLAFRQRMIEQQMQFLAEDGVLYINCVGGYNTSTSGHSYKAQYVRRKELVFPNYKQSDIHISKFPMGEHYYARIGDLELRDGDTIKWNTYREAYDFAKTYIETLE
jgi:hypothetical protein